MKAFTILTAAVALLAAQQVHALTIQDSHPGNPGNLFVAGQPLTLSVGGARQAVSYRVADYFGARVAAGRAAARDGSASISIPALSPGWYQITCSEDGETAKVSLGVVIDRKGAALPVDGRVCSDAASSWLLPHAQEQIKPFARMVKMAGIPWLRERFHWGGVQDETGKMDWGKYQLVLDTLAAEGIHVCDVWHDSPLWTHPTRKSDSWPDDLREVYKFTKTLSSHFANQVQAWEVWNEPDFGFWPHGGDRFAAYQKVAYFGLKDGNPKALVLNGSICGGVTNFVHNVYESGIGEYYDVFDWHTYSAPRDYVLQLDNHYAAMRDEHVAPRPAWLTECGIHLQGTEGDGKRILNDEAQHSQCQFVPRSVSSALAAGTERYFYFVIPDYLENGVQFGALKPDLTTYPSFIALSAAANILGQSRIYLGRYSADGVTAHAFQTPKGSVIVAWADKDTDLVVPTSRPSLTVANIFGSESKVAAVSGQVRVKIGPDAVYILDAGDEALAQFTGAASYPSKLPALKPSRLLIAGSTQLPVEKSTNCYRTYASGAAGTDPSVDYQVDVYNLDDKKSASGSVRVEVPDGWTVDKAEQQVTVGAMGKEILKYRITPGKCVLDAVKVIAVPKFAGENAQPSVSYFMSDPSALTPKAEKPLDWLDAAKWKPACSSNGSVTVTNSAPGMLRFDVKFTGSGDRWAYPEFKFDSTLDLTGYDGISFDMKTFIDDSGPVINMMLVESDGGISPHYMTGTHPHGDMRRVVLLFKDMQPLTFMGEDPNRKLDLDKLSVVKMGCNMFRDDLSFEISNIKAVKLK